MGAGEPIFCEWFIHAASLWSLAGDWQRASVQPILEASYQQRMEVMQAAGVGHGQRDGGRG